LAYRSSERVAVRSADDAVHPTNLSIGSLLDIVQNQLQAMQLSMMFSADFVCRMHVSVRGHAVWAQYLGEGLPLTHFVRIVPRIMLRARRCRICNMTRCTDCTDVAGDDDCGYTFPPHVRLRQNKSCHSGDAKASNYDAQLRI